ncbi:MAG: 4-hydroxy-tetrahydrodipicolinate synthase [Bacteroidia bacterium]|jgi:4-hydroxy-tetrahydrodipicolinate synthase|nr:4-hydroxy-tetrahydrodipicolinate synthase [Bacteroidia bacterium]
MKHKFSGTGVALITPFRPDGNVDIPALRKLVDHVVTGGVEYLVALGTTSEAATLSEDERMLVLETILEQNGGRVHTVAGVGGNNTAEAVQKLGKGLPKGVDGVLSVVPYYNKPTQDGMFAHFSAVAQATDLPVILYNVPGRTASNMRAQTTLKLAHTFSNIVAVKEASGDLLQMMEIIAGKPEGFALLSGDDALTQPIIAMGGEGVVSVVANAWARPFSDMVRHQLANRTQEAQKLHYLLLETINLLFAEGNPGGIKALLNHMQICENVLRLPLVKVTEALSEKLLQQMNLINQNLKP